MMTTRFCVYRLRDEDDWFPIYYLPTLDEANAALLRAHSVGGSPMEWLKVVQEEYDEQAEPTEPPTEELTP